MSEVFFPLHHLLTGKKKVFVFANVIGYVLVHPCV